MKTKHTHQPIRARTLLMNLSIVAFCAWSGLLLFTRYVAPGSVLALCIFFVLLSVALFCTLAPLIYLLTRGMLAKRIAHPTMLHALRQALLISTCIVFNLLLHVLHSWSSFTAVVSFGIIVVIELLALSGK